jgi:serine/threonine-protein kinase
MADAWTRVDEILHSVLLRPLDERDRFLRQACAGDTALENEVRSLLAADEQARSFLEDPAIHAAARAVADDQRAGETHWPESARMALSPGSRLGPYEISSRIGAGGMGEVYRAIDTNLGRQVAIKVLPEAVAADRDRLARFDREARTLAALNHPNIAAIYGLERSGGTTALVMELVEGPTLADRTAQGAIPVAEALPIARQIATALEAAHEQGIIHRDLKPANIKLRPDGTVKVLDFGLAKQTVTLGQDDVTGSRNQSVTDVGRVVGTPAYMAPEQARGERVDKRTDIWAFGCVLFEMLTGRRLFSGSSVVDTLALVMTQEIDWNLLPTQLPTAVRALLRRCLERDPRKRLGDVAAIRFALEDVAGPNERANGETSGDAPAPSRRSQVRPAAISAAAAAVVTAAVALAAAFYFVSSRPASAMLYTNIDLPPGVTLSGQTLALSQDGSKLVVAGQREGQTQLYLKSFDQEAAIPISGTTGAQVPFFSPDGKSIGFWVDGRLRKVPVVGGTPTTICVITTRISGAAWLSDDVIVFSVDSGLKRVSVREGGPEDIATRDTAAGEAFYDSPVALPGGNAVLFSIRYNAGGRSVAVLTLRDGKWTSKPLVPDAGQPRFIAPGFVVVNRKGTLEVAPFDTARLHVGPFTPLGESASMAGLRSPDGGEDVASYDVAAAGRSLVYIKARSTEEPLGIYAIDLDGTSRLLSDADDRRRYSSPAVSPDQNKIAVNVRKDKDIIEIWVLDRVRKWLEPITTGHADWQPRWQGNNTLILGRGSNNSAILDVYTVSATGNATPTQLASFPKQVGSEAVAPDGSAIVFATIDGPRRDLWTQSLGRDGKVSDRQVKLLFDTPSFAESVAPCGFSPDGHWLTFSSNKTGSSQIYVTDWPAASIYQIVTNTGGTEPCWSKEGSQIFYWNGDTVMAVTVRSGKALTAEQKLFDSPVKGGYGYDVSKKGFYVAGYEVSRTSPSSIVFVSDITAALPSGANAK